ncbi:hypothetical protein LIER_21179 [Lithospermum erythrorhizon]|uniref:Uncharacterized protein n=1 Tax=Lithospermum erythrorhizon TaxID=34254 RepID=A0AAV3QPE8_LITER
MATTSTLDRMMVTRALTIAGFVSKVHSRNGMVQIKYKSRASKDDHFILASHAQQVYYLRYVDWNHMQNVEVSTLNTQDIFQEEQQPLPVLVDPSKDVDIVQERVFVIGEDEEDDLGHKVSDVSDYESDYQDNDDYSEEDYFGNNNSDNSSEDN